MPEIQAAPDPREYVDETRLALDDDGFVVLELRTDDGARFAYKFHPNQAHTLSDQLLFAYAETLRRRGVSAEMPEAKRQGT